MNTALKNPLASLALAAGALAAALGLSGHSKQSHSLCAIVVDTPHISTYLIENKHGPAIKTNARTICKAPQSKATVWIELYKVQRFGARSVDKYKPVTEEGTYSPYVIKFQKFFTDCDITDSKTIYFAKAKAEIKLRSGQIEEVYKESKKSNSINCIPKLK